MTAMNEPLQLRLLNDFPVIVAGLRAILAPYSHRVRVAEIDVAGDADRNVDITLYDTFGATMLDQDELGRALRDPRAGKIVIYSWNMDRALVDEALGRGCRGYVAKSASPSELVSVLERVAGGEIVAPEGSRLDVTSSDASANDWPGKHAGLTLRESEVVSLVTQGYTNPEIAARCFITENSLKSYIRTAYRKMGVERRSQAVRWGIENGLLPGGQDGQA